MSSATLSIGPYELQLDRYYDPGSHFWIFSTEGPTHRVGFDPLGAETSGDIVAISVEPVDAHIERGEAFGSLEAAKFVGPLISPVSGVIRAHNKWVSANPALINSTPFDSWLMEIEVDDFAAEEERLLSDPVELGAWLEKEIASFRKKGMVAE